MRLHNLLISAGIISFLTSSVFADCCYRFGLQGAMATGGILGIGPVLYTEITEIGLTLSGQYNNASRQTKSITPVVFGGLRHNIFEKTYFAYGLDFAETFGRDRGREINSNYAVGPYISLEQMFTHHIMLTGWIQPYQYQYEKISGRDELSTNNFFRTGGIAINYLF